MPTEHRSVERAFEEWEQKTGARGRIQVGGSKHGEEVDSEDEDWNMKRSSRQKAGGG